MTRFALIAALLTLAGTASVPARSATDTPLLTNHEQCTAACDHDFELCMDEPSNEREALPGTGPTPSSGAHCRSSMTDCLDRCKGA